VNLFSITQHDAVLQDNPVESTVIGVRPRNQFFLLAVPIYTLGMHLLDGFFRSPSVEPLFSDAAAVQAILDFEAALARAQARGGLISGSAAAAITSSCRADLFDLPSLAQAMPAAGNLAIPLLKQLNAIVGRNSPEALRYVHFGATQPGRARYRPWFFNCAMRFARSKTI